MHNVHGGTSWLKSEPGPPDLGSVCITRISSPTYTFKQVSNLRDAFQAALPKLSPLAGFPDPPHADSPITQCVRRAAIPPIAKITGKLHAAPPGTSRA